MKVLIVDDNKQFLEAFNFLLQENFADKIEEVYLATNG